MKGFVFFSNVTDFRPATLISLQVSLKDFAEKISKFLKRLFEKIVFKI